MDEETGQDGRRKREDALIKDYLTEREELASGPRFHVPPFTIKRIEGTRTIYYAPIGEDPESQLEGMRRRPAGDGESQKPAEAPPAPKPQPVEAGPGRRPTETTAPRHAEPGMPRAFAHLQAGALERSDGPPAAPSGTIQAPRVEERTPEPEEPAPEPVAAPSWAANVIEAADERLPAAVERVTGALRAEEAPAAPETQPEGARPVSFRKPFVKADTFPQRRTGLPPLPGRVSAKELIARLRVVKEGVETREQLARRTAAAGGQTRVPAPEAPDGEGEAEGPATGQAATDGPAGEAEKPAAVAGGVPALAAPSGPAGGALEQKSEGGKLCPSCGMPISERNDLLICTGCGRKNCATCGRYEKSHMRSDVYYEYQFDWPLCLTCYEKAYTIQRMLGRASVCYGNGNFSYALWYARNALQQDPGSRYIPKINDLMEKIDKASKAAGERDREWHFARRQFSRHPVEDPRWRQ
ncbi:MAG: hypothetical protein FJ149_00690 [Euryarchaeota archaeon]|nr:hypothetical protein [Euryarchaeota archaeon]